MGISSVVMNRCSTASQPPRSVSSRLKTEACLVISDIVGACSSVETSMRAVNISAGDMPRVVSRATTMTSSAPTLSMSTVCSGAAFCSTAIGVRGCKRMSLSPKSMTSTTMPFSSTQNNVRLTASPLGSGGLLTSSRAS